MVPQSSVPNLFRNPCEGVLASLPDHVFIQELEVLCRELTFYHWKLKYYFTVTFDDGIESSFELSDICRVFGRALTNDSSHT